MKATIRYLLYEVTLNQYPIIYYTYCIATIATGLLIEIKSKVHDSRKTPNTNSQVGETDKPIYNY